MIGCPGSLLLEGHFRAPSDGSGANTAEHARTCRLVNPEAGTQKLNPKLKPNHIFPVLWWPPSSTIPNVLNMKHLRIRPSKSRPSTGVRTLKTLSDPGDPLRDRNHAQDSLVFTILVHACLGPEQRW